MNEQKFFTETGASVYCRNFREYKMVYGLRMALRSSFDRLRYIVRLWIIRECAIIRILSENYEKIPRRSLSRFLVSIYARFARVKKLIDAIENHYKHLITKNI